MFVGRFKKTPIERKRYTVDYTRWLAATEQIDTFAFAIEPITAPLLEVAGAFVSIDAKSVTYFILGGENSKQYEVHLIITTTDTQIKEVVQHIQVANL